jgi:RNA polymerase sigma-70 factor, ECF subfamily
MGPIEARNWSESGMDVSSEWADADLRDPGGFRAFYEEAVPRVYGYLFHRCGGVASIAEDLTQESFAAAVVEIKRGKRISEPIPWVLSVAKHKLIDHYRREERRERKLSLVWEAERTRDETITAAEVSRERALASLAALPASQRAAVSLRYLDGMSVREVAAALGKSVRATESLLARGRENFKQRYSEASDE